MGKAGARALQAVGRAGSGWGPGWPTAAVSLGSSLLLGVPHPWLQPSPDPLPRDAFRAFVPTPTCHSDRLWLVKVYMLKEDQQWYNQGAGHVVEQLNGMSLLVKA